ncbi:MAG: hypothetical protein VZR09_10245 [Candidatus Gastranaerophilaceae bacterium]|nr:hypothetical protein [Candidatus Gastranaerophilaceae bacterium]
MEKLKGVNKLNRAIAAELAPFGITAAKLVEKDYAYYNNNCSIEYCLVDGTTEDKLFTEFLKERFDYTVKNIWIISIFHEIGHHMTMTYISDEILDFCDTEKDRIAAIMETATAAESKKLEFQYFNLPDEIMATQWAVNYIRSNPRSVEKIWDNIAKAMNKFYFENGVTEG